MAVVATIVDFGIGLSSICFFFQINKNMIKVIVNKTIAVRAHALVNKIKRDESIVFCDCCRIDEQVN